MNERGPAHDGAERPGVVSGEQATIAATPSPRSARPAKGRVDWTGQEVAGRYKVLERLGEGGMGMVYVAEHLHLKKRVAFKVIHPELASHEELMLRFKREALATGQLDHPHIASAIDFGELEDGGAFMVMPLVRGHSLQAELDSGGAMALRRAALLGSQIADALSAAHAVGIVHRDLKPDNVLIERRSDGSEAAKVLDFGVASLAGQGGNQSAGLTLDARPLTQAGTILGTPGYMSPEQASAGEIDHRTDLYALGVILWELCRGERLFDGDDITAIFAKQFNSLPPALELGGSQAAKEMSDLVGKLLAWDKNQRPNVAGDVRDTLRRIAELPDQPTLRLSALSAATPEGLRRYIPHAVAALAILVAVITVAFDEDAEPIVDASGPAATPGAATPPQPSKATKPQPGRVNVGEKIPPGELLDAQEDLLRSGSRDTRRSAAKRVSKNEAAFPPYVALAAKLELAGRCNDKKDVLGEIRTLGDPRVMPALERLDEQPRRGCGLIRLNDCLACLRRELAQTMSELDSKGK